VTDNLALNKNYRRHNEKFSSTCGFKKQGNPMICEDKNKDCVFTAASRIANRNYNKLVICGEEKKTTRCHLKTLLFLGTAQHVSGTRMPIIRSLRLY
jgi:hypothetical protein